MDEVNVVSVAVGRCLDACHLLVDLFVRTFGWLLRFLSGVGVSCHSAVVTLSSSTLVEYWNFCLFYFLTATEAVSSAVHAAVHTVEGWLQTLGGVFESFKMVGHLFCHVAFRTKDLLHRGFTLGSSILRQTCEGVLIALSLVLYFVNTVVNIVLIGTQNCLSVLAGVWEAVAGPVQKVAELALNLLTFLYSGLVGSSVLLWTPFQLLLDFLGALGRVFVMVFMVDSYVLLVTTITVLLCFLVLNPWLPVHVGQLVRRFATALPGAHRVQTTFRRLYTAMPEPAVVHQEVYSGTAQDASGTRLPDADTGGLNTEGDLQPANTPSQLDSPQPAAEPDGATETVCCSRKTSTSELKSAGEDAELLMLLKEQEERKKCVICQDLSKTVLLLPCRHLCLCRPCADILTQRRAARCCPLCRQHITKTMDVFL